MRPELYRLVIFIKRLSRTCIYDNTYRSNNSQTEQFSIISIPKKTHKLSKELSLFAQCLAYLTHNLSSLRCWNLNQISKQINNMCRKTDFTIITRAYFYLPLPKKETK